MGRHIFQLFCRNQFKVVVEPDYEVRYTDSSLQPKPHRISTRHRWDTLEHGGRVLRAANPHHLVPGHKSVVNLRHLAEDRVFTVFRMLKHVDNKLLRKCPVCLPRVILK